MKSKNVLTVILITIILVLTGSIAYINKTVELAIDRTKIPEKVEESRGFQRWLTNLKNKDFVIEADEFRLVEENEIYNTKNTVIYSTDDEEKMAEFENIIKSVQNTEKVVFSPSERQFIDYRHEVRGNFSPEQVHHYGIRDNKIFDSKIIECSDATNCYYDRAYFLNNDVFVISELSRNVNKRDPNLVLCPKNQSCTYTFKIHVIDLVNNSRLVYESKPFDGILDKMVTEL